MPRPRRYHVSSAVIAIAPGRTRDVIEALRHFEGVDVHASNTNRAVITIEGWSTGQLGDRLTEISQMEGVIAANMVFEHAEEEEALQ